MTDDVQPEVLTEVQAEPSAAVPSVPEPAPADLPEPVPDVRPIMVPLPLAAVGALRARGFLAAAEDGDAAIAEGLLAMLDAAWHAGVRADGAPLNETSVRRRDSLDKLAIVNS